MPEGLAFRKGFKVKYPLKIDGKSTHWAPLSLKSLTCSLMSDHHDINLGEGSLALVGQVKGTSGLDTNFLIKFSLLKAKVATAVGKARVERCPSMPWLNLNWRAILLGIIDLSFLLILKMCLKIRRKSTSSKREFFLTPGGVSVTRNRNAL